MPNTNSFALKIFHFSPLPGVEIISRDINTDEKLVIINRDSLPSYCQYELVKAAFSTLEKIQFCEKGKELEQELRTYLTTTRERLDIKSVLPTEMLNYIIYGVSCFAGCYVGSSIQILGVYALPIGLGLAAKIAIGMGIFIGAVIAAPIAAFIALIVMSSIIASIGYGLAGLINRWYRGTVNVKSEKRLNDLIQEINASLEQASQNVTQEPQNQVSQDKVQEPSAANDANANDAKSSSGTFFSAQKLKVTENETAQQTLDHDDECRLAPSGP